MSTAIPIGLPYGVPAVDNTSVVRSPDVASLDIMQTWLCMVRRLNQPYRWGYTSRTTGIDRYKAVLIPPGTTHVRVSCCYTGSKTAGVGPTVSLELPAGDGFGTTSQFPARMDSTSMLDAGWADTTWLECKDVPVASECAHLAVEGHANRVATQWQLAQVKLEIPADCEVWGWACWPEVMAGALTP